MVGLDALRAQPVAVVEVVVFELGGSAGHGGDGDAFQYSRTSDGLGNRKAGGAAGVVSPVPKGEGPGAPSSWLNTVIGTGATRLLFGLRCVTWGEQYLAPTDDARCAK